MADAYVRYRQGGGYQSVLGYDYVLNTRTFIESGYYRDSGFSPLVIPLETVTISSTSAFKTANVGQGTSGTGYGSGTNVAFDASYGTPVNFTSRLPDEVNHTAPRQLSYYETTLTFCADSDTNVTLTPVHADDKFTATAHSLAGKRFTISAVTTMPAGLLNNVIYYAVNPTANSFQVSLSANGPPVAFTDDGTGAITATVVDTLAQFQWSNILGWSNTPPTR
jgi:hypothetical protein